jgi:hypothetical protein
MKSMEKVEQVILRPPGGPVVSPGPEKYQRLPANREIFLAFVVAIRDPLNLHLDIYWPPDHTEFGARYASALNYPYEFVSEELGPVVQSRKAYYCHLRGVEIITTSPDDFHNMKEAYIAVSTRIAKSNGWVLVSVSDIDVYRRVLVNIFDLVDRESINQALLKIVSQKTGLPIAKEYVRPVRVRSNFQPTTLPRDYHIVFNQPV